MSKILIVGGVAGGATTAARLRRLDENAEIILFERGKYVSFANCGLPYYIGGVIADRENLFVMTPEGIQSRLNITVRVENEVIKINRSDKSIEVKDLKSGKTYTEKYDKLVLSPGAEPLRPPIKGIESNKIFTLRNVPDTDLIKSYVTDRKVSKAVIVGAGFIGLEMAENLHHLGINVTIVEMLDQVMAPLDYEMAAEVHQHLKTKNVEFYLKDGVKAFEDMGETISVLLNSGRSINADMVILSIGVRPESQLAKDAGLDVTDRGAIIVDDYMNTNDKDIYALGDAIAFNHPIIGIKINTLLAGPANRQGRIVADNIIKGNVRKYKGSINTAIAKVFDITVASTGVAEKILRKENIPYLSNIIHVGNHAGYYPGAIPMTLKLIFSPSDGRVFGAQAIGYDGVDKRIDVIAALIGKGGTVYDLQDVEHAYAPPYSSAKDPVNIAGYAAENIINGMVKTISWDKLLQIDKNDFLLLDVRTPEEVMLGAIEGSVNIELDTLRKRINEVPKNKKIIVYCAVGLRGYLGSRILMQNGYDEVYNLSGGYKTYEHVNTTQSNEDIFSNNYIGKDDTIYQKAKEVPVHVREEDVTICVDACGLQCPGPIMRLKRETDRLSESQTLLIKATDPGFRKDVASWCNMTGNRLISLTDEKGIINAVIQKQTQIRSAAGSSGGYNKTMVVFSDDFDKALASLVIANGAASTGHKVTMFFTFWGLNILKKKKPGKVKKDFIGVMFGKMLPKGTKKLKLSKMNMMGMGPKMMRMIMKNKKIDSLESMLSAAAESGVEMMACQMSMDVMGVKKEELFDFVKIGGVATYLEATESANLNLFI
ncbi:MAG: CoA-disulfide reductase [Spirochaetes bacterium]|nr:CoA-disulfide reductase [Spirochaetota bacterium]